LPSNLSEKKSKKIYQGGDRNRQGRRIDSHWTAVPRKKTPKRKGNAITERRGLNKTEKIKNKTRSSRRRKKATGGAVTENVKEPGR